MQLRFWYANTLIYDNCFQTLFYEAEDLDDLYTSIVEVVLYCVLNDIKKNFLVKFQVC